MAVITNGMNFDVLRPYVCGGIAAMTAEVLTFPMDTAKTRLQLQGPELRYRGALHTLHTLVQQEGVLSLYRGLSPALLRQAVYGTIKFGLYFSAKDLVAELHPQLADSNAVNLFCAIFAGSVSSAIANPTDVVKVRLQAVQTNERRSLPGVFHDVWLKEGTRGLWRGVWPTTQRSALVAGVQLPVYDWTKVQVARRRLLRDGPVAHLTCSLAAGLAACLASNPLDVIRTRLMVQRRYLKEAKISNSLNKTEIKIYRSALECCTETARREGLLALYKGFVPAFARMGPWNVIFFLVYERLRLVGLT